MFIDKKNQILNTLAVTLLLIIIIYKPNISSQVKIYITSTNKKQWSVDLEKYCYFIIQLLKEN